MFQYIKELLLLNDNVIIPGFGAFVTTTTPAAFKSANYIAPPVKKIDFTTAIQNNDGLLVDHISTKEGISFAAANMNVSTFVADLKQELKQGHKITIPDVGVLFSDNEGDITFKPAATADFDADSFGLPVIQAQEIPKNTPERKSSQAKTPRKSLSEHYASIPLRWKLVIFIGILLVLAILFLPKNIDFKGLYTFGKKEEVPLAVKPEVIDPEKLKKEQEENKLIEAVPVNIGDRGFYIVAGCFEDLFNAKKFVRQLEAKGLKGQIVGKSRGMYVVSYGGFKSRRAALVELNKIQNTVNESAWIFHN